MAKDLRSTTRHFMALAVYVAFAAYLYQPYRQNFQRWEYLFLVNSPLAAVGCYVLSRRWVSSFAGSFFAGVIYGFGPFMLGLARFHPTGRISGGDRAVAVLSCCLWPQTKVADFKHTTFAFAVSGDSAFLSGLATLPLVCGSGAGKVTFSRFGRPCGSAGSCKTRANAGRLLSYPAGAADYGFFYAHTTPEGGANGYYHNSCDLSGSGL